jgi:hypothetical protein
MLSEHDGPVAYVGEVACPRDEDRGATVADQFPRIAGQLPEVRAERSDDRG